MTIDPGVQLDFTSQIAGPTFTGADPVWDNDHLEWLIDQKEFTRILQMTKDAGITGKNQTGLVTEALAEKFVERAKKSTMMRNYALRFVRGTMNHEVRNTLPWHAQAEREMICVTMATLGTKHTRIWREDVRYNDYFAERQIGITGALAAAKAQVFLWREHVMETVDHCPVPRHTLQRSDLPHPIMFWSYENSRTGRLGDSKFSINWMMLAAIADKLLIFHDLCNERDGNIAGELKDQYIVQNYVDFGSTYPDDFTEGSDREAAAQVLARLAFLNSPYVRTEGAPLPRDIRRRGNPMVLGANDCQTSVVTLRREAREAVARERSDEEEHGERSHHWWVTGHMRNQFYPSDGSHKLIWIAPYLKGNLDGPLLDKVYDVRR